MTIRAVLAIDEGTTNSKAVLVAENGEILASGGAPVPTSYPQPGWVQQSAEEIWTATLEAILSCIKAAPEAEIAAIGISNQRESILAWHRSSGEPLGPVVTWQCRRTADTCDGLKAAGHEPDVIRRTGLPLDPLFPATKAKWLLDNHCAGRNATDICLGTVDSWLIWNLSGHEIHATDRSNAARTQLLNIASGEWDNALCELFGVPAASLPHVADSANVFGFTKNVPGLKDSIPIASAVGDSHAALFGHGAFGVGDSKITFGTGSSVMTTVPEIVAPPKGITTTIAWSLGGRITYALEGNILVSASILPWTAQLLGLDSVDALLDLAQTVDETVGVALVPAHVGLGSPHWNADARGLISGLTFSSEPAHVARAATDSLALQVLDIYKIMSEASPHGIGRLFVDGGPSRNTFLMTLVAGYLGHAVTTCRNTEASALGAAFLAGLATGVWPDLKTIASLQQDRQEIAPDMCPEKRKQAINSWQIAIARSTMTDI